MERIILIETSTALCSVALAEEGNIVAYRESSAPKAHASLTAVFIQEMLSERGLTTADCDAVCVSMGPGSYTGLRVGVSTAKGLCFGSGKPLLAVGTLDTLVAQADSDARFIIPMVDARRMEVYTAMYTATFEKKSEIEAKVIDEQSFAELLCEKNIYFFGNGAEKCQSVIASSNAHFLTGILPQAKYMGKLAEQTTSLDIKQIAYYEPFYLKEFVPAPSHIKGLKS